MAHRRIARLTPLAKRIVGPELAARKPSIRIPKGIPFLGKLAQRSNTRQVLRDIATATARVARQRR